MIIGGKPHVSIPSFIPVTFELTVLFTAFGMVGTFLIISGLRPRAVTPVFDARSTDDKFIMAIQVKPDMDLARLHTLLRENGAVEVNEKEVVA
jgi:hypothetical protein